MKKLQILFMAFILVITSACSKSVQTDAFELPSLKIALLPMFQAEQTTELIAGYFPENRLLANENQLNQLSMSLKTKVSEVNPYIQYIASYDENEFINDIDSQNTKGMLGYWVALGKNKNVDLLLLPQVSYYNDQEKAGLNKALMMDFFLIDTRAEGALMKRSHFAEEVQNEDDESQGMLSFSRRIGKEDMPSIINDAFENMIETFDLAIEK